ncbi:hypothetical protein MUK42_35859 [Musa troglodytarum]|uniref:Uncharacterized protein n=1 Tax=Musa troglodytarum TaxID=320322 RepID=A0A9E7JXZ4_9LILI|nr:hypothetical protein MUK42_35859 [Musa troglodytarum]
MLLLRSASLPLLNSSWVAAPKEAAARELPVGEGELVVPLLPRAPFAGPPHHPLRRLALRLVSAREAAAGAASDFPGAAPRLPRLAFLAGYRGVSVGVVSDAWTGGGDGGRRTCNGGTGRRGSGGGGGDAENDGSGGLNPSDSNHGNDATDAYYLQMMKADPGNSLILGNYAKFLKEVRGDVAKAQEYCERAILANPGDAGVLALDADLVWETSRDAPRAETYFRRAVQAAPGDRYILASYARVLWDAEEEEEDYNRWFQKTRV